MTSKDIEIMAPTDISTNAWLKLIALQGAILIESLSTPTVPVDTAVQRVPDRPQQNARRN